MSGTESPKAAGAAVTVVGPGGNIGSHLVPLLARMGGIRRLNLVDPDVYEAKNVASQDITPRDVGRPKVLVQARRARRINPALEVFACAAKAQDVPLGRLRADVLVACVDSRDARCFVNQAAWRLGRPWIDGGVNTSEMLARVNVYVPGPDSACYECAFDERDYALLEQEYACSDDSTRAATDGFCALGAFVASVQAIECRKLLQRRAEPTLAGRQLLVDVVHHRQLVTTFRRNPNCRFDHGVWPVTQLNVAPGKATIADVLSLPREAGGPAPAASLRVEGDAFVRRLRCTSCGHRRDGLLRLGRRLTASQRSCARCGGKMVSAGFDQCEGLAAPDLSRAELKRTLRSVGLRAGDVLTLVRPAGETHCEIGCEDR